MEYNTNKYGDKTIMAIIMIFNHVNLFKSKEKFKSEVLYEKSSNNKIQDSKFVSEENQTLFY